MAVAGNRVHDAVARAREVTDHPALEHLARVGLIAYGFAVSGGCSSTPPPSTTCRRRPGWTER